MMRWFLAVFLFFGLAGAAAVALDKPLVPREAFEEAKQLGTIEGWEAFLESYPKGFHADMARAYLKKLNDAGGAPAPAQARDDAPAGAPPVASSESATAEPRPVAAYKAAITRGAKYMGFPEKFNRYYTDAAWIPAKTVFVSPDGSGDGSSRDKPASPASVVDSAGPGTMFHFLRGAYENACFDFPQDKSGTYDDPIVLRGERNDDNTIGVTMTCCKSERGACINLEAADYIAVDGFELVGGKYGVRAAGAGYPASEHARGIAVMNNRGRDQDKDPFFSGQADWTIWEGNVASGAKEEDGHGIYISNGSDWNIVRFNETFNNASSDFQINADPASACDAVDIPYNDPRCDAYAGTGAGGQGASDFFLVESNYFHHSDVGPNFTSVRKSIIRNNIFGPQTRHNVSFWQETDNPKLGSSDNRIVHNLFITNGRHGVQFSKHSTRNGFENNVLVGMQVKGGKAKANTDAVLMEVDDTAGSNVFRGNLYSSGKLEGRMPGAEETAREDFAAGWFRNFPVVLSHDAEDFTPAADAPFVAKGKLTPNGGSDRAGKRRSGDVDLGPIEVE